jgi:hypothetical protein
VTLFQGASRGPRCLQGTNGGNREWSRRDELLALYHQGDLVAAHTRAASAAEGVPGTMHNTRLRRSQRHRCYRQCLGYLQGPGVLG